MEDQEAEHLEDLEKLLVFEELEEEHQGAEKIHKVKYKINSAKKTDNNKITFSGHHK